MKSLVHLAFLTSVVSQPKNNFHIDTYKTNDITNTINFLKKINEATFIINDMCESLEESYSIISGSNKPKCNYNMSSINQTDIIIYPINEQIIDYFRKEKHKFCKEQKMECGELTIIIKMSNLINSAVNIAIRNDINDLFINLEIIDFDSKYYLYRNSLSNLNIITNITLAKQKSNVILNREKTRLDKIQSKTYFSGFTDRIEIWIGDPIKNTLNYLSNTTGETISSLLQKVLPDVSIEFKIIIILCLIIYIKK